MDKDTLKALKGSVRKWERIVDGRGADNGTYNCPLCKMFLLGEMRCAGCPVKEASGQSYCRGTPYENWDDVVEEELDFPRRISDLPSVRLRRDALRYAKDEVRFLKGLLPQEGGLDK